MRKFEIGDIVRVRGRGDRWDGHTGQISNYRLDGYFVDLFTTPEDIYQVDEYFFAEGFLEEVD